MNAIVRQILEGHKDAFRTIVKEHGPSVRAYLAGHAADAHTVDDLAQETFIAAYESLAKFDDALDMGAWLRGIARNRLLMHRRRLSQHGRALDRLKAEALDAVFEDLSGIQEKDSPDTLQRLRQCLGKLPDHAREVVQARHLQKEKVASIALRLRTSVTAISSLLFRGRKMLEACLEGQK